MFVYLQGKVVQPHHHPGALPSLMMYNSEHIASPPPAHMGIPPVHIDPKTGNTSGMLSPLIPTNISSCFVAIFLLSYCNMLSVQCAADHAKDQQRKQFCKLGHHLLVALL